MFRRFSIVDRVNISSLGISGVAQVGDTNSILIRNRQISVQKEGNVFRHHEAPFAAYGIFLDKEITIPTRTKEVRMKTINACPFIHVNEVSMLYVFSTSVFHIGSVEDVFMNSRGLQIRLYK